MKPKRTNAKPPILMAPVILFALALFLMLGIAPWSDALFVPGLLLVSCGLIGMALVLALRLIWRS